MLASVASLIIMMAVISAYVFYLPGLNPLIPLILIIIICFPILYLGELKKRRAGKEQRSE